MRTSRTLAPMSQGHSPSGHALPWLLVLVLLGCQSDQERARELLEGPGAGTGEVARDALTQATALDPTLREAFSRLADVHLAASHWVEAEAAASRAITLADDASHDHETRAQAAIGLERWDLAERDLARAIELGAPEAPARTRLGKVQEHLSRPDDALTSYRRAVELDGAQLEARLGLARILLARLQTAAEVSSWHGDEPLSNQIRVQLEAARGPAEGTPLAEEVAALSADLASIEELASTRAREAEAERERVMASLLGSSSILDALGDAHVGALDDVLWGDQIGDAFGARGLGLRGVGEGGGGEEGIGLGNIGTIGRGGGTGGGLGGLGSGGMGVRRPDAVGVLVTVTSDADGALDASVVQAAIRRQSGRLRACYEQALSAEPALAGTMRIETAVTSAGAAESPRASGLGGASIASCMSQTIARVAFPPSSGSTRVSVSVACAPSP